MSITLHSPNPEAGAGPTPPNAKFVFKFLHGPAPLTMKHEALSRTAPVPQRTVHCQPPDASSLDQFLWREAFAKFPRNGTWVPLAKP